MGTLEVFDTNGRSLRLTDINESTWFTVAGAIQAGADMSFEQKDDRAKVRTQFAPGAIVRATYTEEVSK